jgi:hypothetical protein
MTKGDWDYIPPPLPYKCIVNPSARTSALMLLHQLPLLKSASYQSPNSVKADTLFFLVFRRHSRGASCLFKMLFNVIIDACLKLIFSAVREQ